MDSLLFIGTVIAGITEAIRLAGPRVNGAVTIGVAALVGLLVGFFDVTLGVVDVSPAAGLLAGLASAGVVATAKRIG